MTADAETVLLEDGIVITVDDTNRVLSEGGVLVADGEIAAVGDPHDIEATRRVDRRVDASGKAILPGLVDLHLHSGFIRGLAEDMPVFEWLNEHVDPTHEALRREEARVAYELAYAEMARAGITTALDMYRFMDEAADVAEEYGVRVTLAPYVADEYDYFESLEDNRRLVEERHGDADGRVRVWYGLEHLTYATEEAYHKVAEYAAEAPDGVGIHTHGEESREMHERLTAEYGQPPIAELHERGILGPDTVLAHVVWLEPEERELIAETGTGVAHCPVSNMKLASGVAPIPDLLERGVPVGVGGDGIKENNRIDVIQEMKQAALLQKVHELDATLVPAEQALRMGTIGGARALGLEDEIGSIEPGKRADLTLLDLEQLHMSPVLQDPHPGGYRNVVPNVVHAAQAADVSDVMVDGEWIVRHGEFLPADHDELLEKHERATRQVLERRDG
jgi:5-methylthioadenosine/S-adenosylhomocysteine deaminase